jgi:hypothetical protein
MSAPLTSSCLVTNECAITASDMRANAVVTKVKSEVDHGFLNLDRRVCARESAILSIAMSSPLTGGTLMTVDCKAAFSRSKETLRDSAAGFQFVLLGLRLLATADFLSVLVLRSKS